MTYFEFLLHLSASLYTVTMFLQGKRITKLMKDYVEQTKCGTPTPFLIRCIRLRTHFQHAILGTSQQLTDVTVSVSFPCYYNAVTVFEKLNSYRLK